MTKRDVRTEQASKQRQEAEEIALKRTAPSPTNLEEMSLEEMRRTLHELQIYQNIISSTPDGVAFLDKNYRYIIVNRAYERYSGVSQEKIIGLTIAEYLGEEVFQRFIKPNFD
jgi:PAS domain-containing protein